MMMDSMQDLLSGLIRKGKELRHAMNQALNDHTNNNMKIFYKYVLYSLLTILF